MSDFYAAVNGSDLAVDDLSYLSKGQSAKQLYNSAVLIEKTIVSNGVYPASADDADGYSKVTVNVPGEQPVLVGKLISANGTYNASDDNADGYYQVIVNVQPALYPVTCDEAGVIDANIYKKTASSKEITYCIGIVGVAESTSTLTLHYPEGFTITAGTRFCFVADSSPALHTITNLSVDSGYHTITITFAEALEADAIYYVYFVSRQN